MGGATLSAEALVATRTTDAGQTAAALLSVGKWRNWDAFEAACEPTAEA